MPCLRDACAEQKAAVTAKSLEQKKPGTFFLPQHGVLDFRCGFGLFSDCVGFSFWFLQPFVFFFVLFLFCVVTSFEFPPLCTITLLVSLLFTFCIFIFFLEAFSVLFLFIRPPQLCDDNLFVKVSILLYSLHLF